MYDAFKQTLDKTNNPDAARSAAVDCYLDAALDGKKPSVEKVASVCKDAKGQSYYIDPKTVAAMAVTKAKETAETKTDEKKETLKESYKEPVSIFKEPAFNATLMAKMKQGGR